MRYERDIKFRGKVKHHDPMTNPENGWVEGFYYQDLKGGEIKHFIKCAEMDWEIIPETLGQYTGLLDRNGKEIYEDDILKGTSYLYGYQLANGKQFNYEGFVEWQSQCDVGLCWILSDLDDSGAWDLKQTVHRNCIDFSTGDIIGNIHDNPELLRFKL